MLIKTNSREEKIRILLVDDHPLFIVGFQHIIEFEPQFVVVGNAVTGNQALAMAEQLKPDLVICDLNLPDMDGLNVTRLLVKRFPDTQIIILSMYEDDDQVVNAFQAGAAGYCSKTTHIEKILKLMVEVGQKQPSLTTSVATSNMLRSQENKGGANSGATGLNPLTMRESEVLEAIAFGCPNREVASTLSISEHTVRAHINNILKKLRVNDRTQAVLAALRYGWIKVPVATME
ncbi:MAG: response regulator transcription factor [Chloroflexi bacterium]|uniref:Response regulator transcription factor n=1 Tax=Candidatus Chlorohelix allophototropha TaxID=3003348 RepID=A0A8T7M1H7_9CHLR|nr:response regulator transcription factor [Chloroflexota bacterium]WJW66467.1 response regulator transcription factor [Chloroflexota bacterium L227-S17]